MFWCVLCVYVVGAALCVSVFMRLVLRVAVLGVCVLIAFLFCAFLLVAFVVSTALML